MTPTAVHESSIIERLIFTRDKAEAILSLAFSPEDRERMRDLMDRNNKGALSGEEQSEMESFRRIGTFLGILQARARVFLETKGAGNGPGR
jgi:hypothetical protein